jgi:hypothetical protein
MIGTSHDMGNTTDAACDSEADQLALACRHPPHALGIEAWRLKDEATVQYR